MRYRYYSNKSLYCINHYTYRYMSSVTIKSVANLQTMNLITSLAIFNIKISFLLCEMSADI